MRKIRISFIVVLTTILCVSMCSCGLIEKMSGIVYNTGDLQEGYTLITSVNGVEFAMPTDLYEGAVNMEDVDEYVQGTLTVDTYDGYYVLSDSENLLYVVKYVGIADDDIDDAVDDIAEEYNFELGSGLTSFEGMGESKAICKATYTDKLDITYNGYYTVLQNSSSQTFMMFCGVVEEDYETMEYLVKSLKFAD